VKRTGKRLRTEHLEVRAHRSSFSHVRLSVVVSKQGHTVVERNRLRRRLRELARIRIIPVTGAIDIMIRSLSSAYTLTFQQLAGEIDKIGLLLSEWSCNSG